MAATAIMVLAGMVALAVELSSAGQCSPSCLVQDDIISCRQFDGPADVLACARRHPRASVLDLSYITVRHPLTRRSLTGYSATFPQAVT